MKKGIMGLIALIFLVFQSCQEDNNDSNDRSNVNQNTKVVLNSNAQSLADRMSYDNSGVIGLVTNTNTKTGKSSLESNLSSFPMSLLAEINPPTYEGITLRATHVAVKDNYVYVSYNTQGDTYLGAIDVIDVSQPYNPQLIVQAILPNVDISTVAYENGNLYIAGATDVDKNALLTSPAFVGKMPLQNGMLSSDYNLVSLVGNVATGIVVADSKYYGVSGNRGVVAKIDKVKNTVEATIAVADLRAMGRIDNKIIVLSGTEGIKVFDADDLSLKSSFVTSKDVPDAKRTIDFQGNNLLVSEGYQGLKVYDLNSGSLLQTLQLPTNFSDVDAGDVVTNGVSVNGDFVYVANGAAGVSVYKKVNNSLSFLGSIQLGGSSNYVKSVGDYIYVATGSGLKIIKKLVVTSIECAGFPVYPGNSNLIVSQGQTLNYSGNASVHDVEVNQDLAFCGALAVFNSITINSGGVFGVNGYLAQGNSKNTSGVFTVNGTFRLQGDMTIYGNLVLNNGAKLEFLGTNCRVKIYGSVTKGTDVTVTGNYTEVDGKLKK